MDNLAFSEKVVDVSRYTNIDSVLDQPSIRDADNFELIKSIAQLGHAHSKSGIQFNHELAEYIYAWERVLRKPTEGIILNLDEYTLRTVAAIRHPAEEDCKRCREREQNFMKRTIPLSYVIWGGISLALSVVFITMMVYGIKFGFYLVNPWINLALCVGSTGLTITIIMAMFEWGKRLHGKGKEKGNGE